MRIALLLAAYLVFGVLLSVLLSSLWSWLFGCPREVGHSQGARARGSNGAAICGAAFCDAPSYRAAEAPIGRKVQREVLTGRVVEESLCPSSI